MRQSNGYIVGRQARGLYASGMNTNLFLIHVRNSLDFKQTGVKSMSSLTTLHSPIVKPSIATALRCYYRRTLEHLKLKALKDLRHTGWLIGYIGSTGRGVQCYTTWQITTNRALPPFNSYKSSRRIKAWPSF